MGPNFSYIVLRPQRAIYELGERLREAVMADFRVRRIFELAELTEESFSVW